MRGAVLVLCPLKSGSLDVGIVGQVAPVGRGAESHEGIEVHGGAKGVHPEGSDFFKKNRAAVLTDCRGLCAE